MKNSRNKPHFSEAGYGLMQILHSGRYPRLSTNILNIVFVHFQIAMHAAQAT